MVVLSNFPTGSMRDRGENPSTKVSFSLHRELNPCRSYSNNISEKIR